MSFFKESTIARTFCSHPLVLSTWTTGYGDINSLEMGIKLNVVILGRIPDRVEFDSKNGDVYAQADEWLSKNESIQRILESK